MTGWQAIRDDVRARIAAREWVPGALIPGEEALAASYGVARATVNRALRDLAGSGLVERRRKAGTRVAQGAARRAVLSIPVIREQVEALDQAHSFQILTLREEEAPDHVLRALMLMPDVRLLHIDTLHRADGRPHALETRWLNLGAVPGPLPDLMRITVNEWLLQTVPYATGEIVFSAEPAGAGEAGHLDCAIGAALFVTERVTRTAAGPVTWVRLAHAPGWRMRTTL
ncbi:MAG: GntR family transcriptional regulator [Gemmobacter sp.]